MNTALLLLFISFAFSKDLIATITKDGDGNTVMFTKLEFEKCYYTSAVSSMYLTHDGDSVTCTTYLASSDCTGSVTASVTADLNDDKIKKAICSGSGDNEECSVEIKRAPRHNGFQSIILDDSDCSHRDNTQRLYVTKRKYQCGNNGTYCRYKEEDDVMYLDKYPNDKMKNDERISHDKAWECDKCSVGFMYQCGAVSTFIVSALFIFALLF
ncbi:hypothetical protein EHI8A_217310 [Entamoeba histolytica HM-1:IMSS-B]|uniref:Uncharacterized protein n=4 Tax=Entamoeba histolytica TaxID=5759 RepID=C4M3Q6_ENTH1|nr:hypothetical protein EHI_146120 [Entamoeba histolytica HM-1:IMSS]EAL44498.1 hypothetical protein EHI_146120 [Entamoeba histolytica HM-1:IMSS]EMH76283.1 hypothetical protein EHI8A_217310 [Entamoeba histolytica HM-1:IMSS-B]ENY65099.1 hypothetical protein EHI7A_186990 [Entamoeba histolytica HM-1:IMSS-A]GAT95961.1 hypothetical protein CL6EHI_146120 [Entamoeba histolytica]|eukprot:XP_649884.1 hypothetical protein EHI_146120 [Entamoeba histolytica HM-1:IMSS]